MSEIVRNNFCALCWKPFDVWGAYECGQCEKCYNFALEYDNELYRTGQDRFVDMRELRTAYAEYTGDTWPLVINRLDFALEQVQPLFAELQEMFTDRDMPGLEDLVALVQEARKLVN